MKQVVKPIPPWLIEHRARQPYPADPEFMEFSRSYTETPAPAEGFLRDVEFNRHAFNDGTHVSPFDEGRVDYGLDNLEVRLEQGIDEESFKRVLSRALRATTGIHPDEPDDGSDYEEMMKGGLQSALETQTIVFSVFGASRALTHQLVRTRKAGFHQQSQRATWYGDKPNARWPESVQHDPEGEVGALWEKAQTAAWEAYRAACDAGISYQDARYILPEGTTNYILCEYTVREFINTFAYRGCSMFLWEMVGVMREMRRVLLEAHPMLEPYVKISCENGKICAKCAGTGWLNLDGSPASMKHVRENAITPEHLPTWPITECKACRVTGGRRCTFQGWENVENQCDFPWARQDNRVFLPAPKFRIGKAS